MHACDRALQACFEKPGVQYLFDNHLWAIKLCFDMKNHVDARLSDQARGPKSASFHSNIKPENSQASRCHNVQLNSSNKQQINKDQHGLSHGQG